MIKCCTRDCPNRSATCHAECEQYAKERAEMDERRAKEYEGQYFSEGWRKIVRDRLYKQKNGRWIV